MGRKSSKKKRQSLVASAQAEAARLIRAATNGNQSDQGGQGASIDNADRDIKSRMRESPRAETARLQAAAAESRAANVLAPTRQQTIAISSFALLLPTIMPSVGESNDIGTETENMAGYFASNSEAGFVAHDSFESEAEILMGLSQFMAYNNETEGMS